MMCKGYHDFIAGSLTLLYDCSRCSLRGGAAVPSVRIGGSNDSKDASP